MRIAQVNDIAYVGSTLVRALRALDVDAILVEPPRPGASVRYPWKLAALPFRVAGLIATGVRLRGGGFDLVHAHYARLGMVGPLSGRPYVLHCHGSDIRGVTPDSVWGREVAPFLKAADHVYYATPDLAPWVRAFRADATFMPNPIELPPAETLAPEAFDADLLVGVRLDPIKGLDAIVATLAEVVRRRPATTLTVIAQGRGVPVVQAIAPEGTRVISPVPHAGLPALIRRHRVVVGQLAVGAIGNYELEAMACGRPVVSAFRFPAAYPFPPPILDGSDPAEIARSVVEVLEDRGRAVEIGDAGRAWVEANHASPQIARRVIDDYRRILGVAPGAGGAAAGAIRPRGERERGPETDPTR